MTTKRLPQLFIRHRPQEWITQESDIQWRFFHRNPDGQVVHHWIRKCAECGLWFETLNETSINIHGMLCCGCDLKINGKAVLPPPPPPPTVEEIAAKKAMYRDIQKKVAAFNAARGR